MSLNTRGNPKPTKVATKNYLGDKIMKKTNLITTLALVVIVAIALSTATYAWYTSQSNVNANTTLYAAQSTSASLAIDKEVVTSSTGAKTSVELTLSGEVQPMVPTAAPTNDSTSMSFITSPKNAEGKFTTASSSTAAATISKVGNDTQTYFYVSNTDSTNNAKVKAYLSIDADGYTRLKSQPADWATNGTQYYKKSTVDDKYTALSAINTETFNATDYYVKNSTMASFLRVAVFVSDKYVGTLAGGSEAKTNWVASWEKDATIATVFDGKQYTATTLGTDGFSIGTIAKQSGVKVSIYAWFDGEGLVDALNGLGTAFTLNFAVTSSDSGTVGA